jgi:RNA polymerase sigma-70 factor (ECF subfamily)
MRDAEGRFADEPVATDSPERLFDRHWALGALDEVFAAVERDYAAAERAPVFAELKAALWGEGGDVPYQEIARRLGTTESAIKMAALRLRKRVRETLRAEVAKTLLDPADVDQELQHLLATLSA